MSMKRGSIAIPKAGVKRASVMFAKQIKQKKASVIRTSMLNFETPFDIGPANFGEEAEKQFNNILGVNANVFIYDSDSLSDDSNTLSSFDGFDENGQMIKDGAIVVSSKV